MSWLSGAWKIILAIPQIISVIRQIQAVFAQKQEKRHEDAVDKLRRAETEDEIKDAMRDIARNP